MRLPRMPLLLVAFTVPTSVTTAYAESAWVLWKHSYEVWVDNNKEIIGATSLGRKLTRRQLNRTATTVR